MTTKTRDPKTRDSKTERASGRLDGDRVQVVARDMVRAIGDATDDLDDRLSSAADATGVGVRMASDALRRRSDATLAMLGTFSLGLTTGLLVGGANRLLTVASLFPAALISGVVLERVDGRRRSRG